MWTEPPTVDLKDSLTARTHLLRRGEGDGAEEYTPQLMGIERQLESERPKKTHKGRRRKDKRWACPQVGARWRKRTTVSPRARVGTAVGKGSLSKGPVIGSLLFQYPCLRIRWHLGVPTWTKRQCIVFPSRGANRTQHGYSWTEEWPVPSPSINVSSTFSTNMRPDRRNLIHWPNSIRTEACLSTGPINPVCAIPCCARFPVIMYNQDLEHHPEYRLPCMCGESYPNI